eukprot:TRINITY_DN23407_c0_g1_i1.p1 TRINITY_DN23407_c0_g1~~TRINITY_DN23407_c0_g1_i1.p1  ORF type:complete len:115 (+),score=50.23 TRINITY_DN23407_c0_g1_i1:51-347(+)
MSAPAATVTQQTFQSLVLARTVLHLDKRTYPTEEVALQRAERWLCDQVQLEAKAVAQMKPRMERSISHYYADKRADYTLGLELDEEPPFDLRCSRNFY